MHIFLSVSRAVSPRNGTWPVTSRYRMTPNAKMSALGRAPKADSHQLRRYVARRAVVQTRELGTVGRLGESNFRLAVIRYLDTIKCKPAVDSSNLVNSLDCRGHLLHEARCSQSRASRIGQDPGQGKAVNQFHHEPQVTVVLPDCMELDDIRMLQARHYAGFVVQMRSDWPGLQEDQSIKLQIQCFVDTAPGVLGERFKNLVLARRFVEHGPTRVQSQNGPIVSPPSRVIPARKLASLGTGRSYSGTETSDH